MESSPKSSNSMQRFCLRPSPLAAQAEKLQLRRTFVTVSAVTDNKPEGCHSTTEERSTVECKDGANESQMGLNVDQNPFQIRVANIGKQNNSTSPEEEDDKRPGCPREDFVFGQNLHERVVSPESSSESCLFQSSNMTFEQAASGLNDSKTDSDNSENQVKPKKSLSESAEEYQQRQVKRKYSEVEIVTGEEGEFNVLQISCKLFAFDQTLKTWKERGRGMLRLNDREVGGILQSRLVMRTHGSLRVILNTNVWPGMRVERRSNKTVRISALDSDGIKVYLIKANNKDADQLFGGLECRITSLKRNDDDTHMYPDSCEYPNCDEQPSPKRQCLSSDSQEDNKKDD